MNVVFLGATKGMGRALARRMVARGDRLFLLGRDREALARTASDLGARGERGGGVAGFAELDLLGLVDAASSFEEAQRALDRVEAVVVTAGQFAPQDQLEADLGLTAQVLDLDFTRTVLFCEAARRCLLASGGGKLCVFSSVAGDRGRGAQVLYGAAKAGLSSYLEGLDHRWHRAGLQVVCVKPGFVRTGMTAGLPEPPFAGEPDAVAERVLRSLDRGAPVVYAPGMWRWVMLTIRWLPRWVMRRVRF
jgi:decaprenylphospho-beta-D-erythro-pentofuranosid-2-ulose 2-reductase